MDARCAVCGVKACISEEDKVLPGFCPMADEEIYKSAFEVTTSEEYKEFFVTSSYIEHDGYRVWPRVKETMELIRRMKYERVGLAFCKMLTKEAKILDEIFRRNDINLISTMCKTGGVEKENVGIPDADKLRPGTFEPICNPVAQAMILNKEKTEFNIVMGLCVGHDSLFYKFSDALCTTLVVKDRVTGNNPAVILYCADGMFSNRIDLDKDFKDW